MTYNFDEVIERRGTDSVKWDGVKSVWGRDDLLPMWVADMDFRTPPFVMEALRKRLEHEVLGYTSACEEWYTSICSWLSRRLLYPALSAVKPSHCNASPIPATG